jgi:hypothetical protein
MLLQSNSLTKTAKILNSHITTIRNFCKWNDIDIKTIKK